LSSLKHVLLNPEVRPLWGNGDDLILGAAKLHLKISEISIHYLARTYGTPNINRFQLGWLLLRMSVFTMRRMKLVV
jgi:hypothetical protein